MVSANPRDFDVFDVLVRYHFEENYSSVRNTILKGKDQLTDSKILLNYLLAHPDEKVSEVMDKAGHLSGMGITEGKSEVETNGFLILADGSLLLEQMVKDNIVKRENIMDPIPVSSEAMLLDYLKRQDNKDGAYVIDTEKRIVRRVVKFTNEFSALLDKKAHELNKSKKRLESTKSFIQSVNRLPFVIPSLREKEAELEGKIRTLAAKIPRRFKSKLPENFIYHLGDIEGATGNRYENADYNSILGLKTRLAIGLPQIYPHSSAFQTKRTAYGRLGMGIVTNFTETGLSRRFHYIHAPGAKLHLDPEKKVLGIYEFLGHKGRSTRPQVLSRIVAYSDNGQISYMPLDKYKEFVRPVTERNILSLTNYQPKGVQAASYA